MLDEAKKARETAELAVNTSIKALAAAEAAAQKAKDRVPAAQKILAGADAAVKQAEAQLALGKKAATDSEQPLRSVAFSSDNQQLATGNEAGLVHTWSRRQWASVRRLRRPPGPGRRDRLRW